MPVSPQDSARFLRAQEAREQEDLETLYRDMRRDAERVVSEIARRYRPRRIMQWGSLLVRSRFRGYSDIDIAVEGVEDPRRWAEIERLAWEMTDYPLDLVQLEHVEPEFRELIREKGTVVYEQQE